MTRPLSIRDPLWNTIQLDTVAARVIDSAAFQRLRYIKQLGHAHLVYPGATHTRFDHAVGVYHLARRALRTLAERAALDEIDPLDCAAIPLAGLLHDVGHYPFSHALEELEPGLLPGHHEALTGRFLADPDVQGALDSVGRGMPERIEALIRGTSTSPLQGLVSGSLDLDKIEYLDRDARFCGVPYGEVDVDRLLYALVLLPDPVTGRAEVGVLEKGVAALESLLFAKYQMFRNVYWHHAVRAATVRYKRIVADALDAGLLESAELVGETDEGLMHLLAARAAAGESGAARRVVKGIEDLRRRRLPKRAGEIAAADIPEGDAGGWLETDSPLKREVEEAVAAELKLPAGAVYLDYPEKRAMFGLDLLVRRRTGEVIRLGPGGRSGLIGLPRVADELYRTARVLRLFTAGERRSVAGSALARVAAMDTDSLRESLRAGTSLLG